MIGLELGAGPRDAAGGGTGGWSGGVIRQRAVAGAAIVPRVRMRVGCQGEETSGRGDSRGHGEAQPPGRGKARGRVSRIPKGSKPGALAADPAIRPPAGSALSPLIPMRARGLSG
jgi:hypothetical protein